MTGDTQRRLAAIVLADVVGYSRLMGADETGTLDAMRTHRQALWDPTIERYGGRVVNRAGDSALIEFASAVAAMECSVAIQTAMAERNKGIPGNKRVDLRVGVNVGEVVVEGDEIYGDGVNVAARLQTLADPGGIALSGNVYENIVNRLDLTLADDGEHAVKNIARPVHVWRWRPEPTPETGTLTVAPVHDRAPLALPDKPSIAVLPFDNMSGDAEQEYFADGMVEDIITGISRIKWLFVIARNSSFTYKGRAVDIKQVGRELGVRYVLEGSVRRASNRVRVTGQLIEAETGRHIWADRYDRTLEDVFEIQDELTMNVVAAIEPSLRQAEIERVKRKRPDNLDAYDLVLRAMPHVYPAMPEGALAGLELLDCALEKEPTYALAHGFAAWAHEIVYARGGGHERNRDNAIRHAHSAIALGRDDAIALTLGGFTIGLVAHDRDAACQALEAALSVSPSCALTYIFGSVVMAYAGDSDLAIEWGECAIRLSPVDPMLFAPWYSIFLGRFQRREYDSALAAARKVQQGNPDWSLAHVSLAAAHARSGNPDAARSAAGKILELQPNYTISDMCASFDIHPSLATPLSEALAEAGLPP